MAFNAVKKPGTKPIKLRNRGVVLARKVLFLEPNPRNEVPPLSAPKLLSRIFELWDLPRGDMFPKEVCAAPKDGSGGKYYFDRRLFFVDPSVIIDKYQKKGHTTEQALDRIDKLKNHEQTHDATLLIAPQSDRERELRMQTNEKAYKRHKLIASFGFNTKTRQTDNKHELAAGLSDPAHKDTYEDQRRKHEIRGWKGAAVSMLIPPLGLIVGAKVYARSVEFGLQKKVFREMYARHGIDGLVLFFAAPPRTFGSLEIKIWENKMLKNGFLDKKGLTKKGVEYLHRAIPREEIIQRIEKAKKLREERPTE